MHGIASAEPNWLAIYPVEEAEVAKHVDDFHNRRDEFPDWLIIGGIKNGDTPRYVARYFETDGDPIAYLQESEREDAGAPF